MSTDAAAAAAALAAVLASLNPAELAELPYLTAEQNYTLLHAPSPVMTAGQFLTVLLYLYSAGVILNGTVLFAALFNYKKLLRSPTDRLTMGLISAGFVWSVGRALIHALQGIGKLDTGNAGAAAFSNIMVTLIFTLNSHLAMERYFQIQEPPYAKTVYSTLWVFYAATVALIFWTFSTSPTSDGIKPDNSVQKLVWIVMLSITYGVTSIVMAWFYTRTYRFSARQFAENPALATFFLKDKDGKSDDPETLGLVRIRVEREILTKCLLLSITVMILYAPFYAYQVQSYFVGAIPFFDLTGIYYMIGVILLAADIIVTPLLVFFFKAEIRDALIFWK
ncbi:hypothetical protein HDU83_008681 [Entophlyctis luteolus]|nr:hypothetical protein HDU83_008681 [Entophlyctis luteolus]